MVLDRDALIGIGSYERSAGSDAAEIAFEVDDAQQGRGIGTLLFEMLAAAARERGIRRFVANVLPQNRRMLQLFREVGLAERTRFEGGVVEVELELAPPPARDGGRWRRRRAAASPRSRREICARSRRPAPTRTTPAPRPASNRCKRISPTSS